MNIYFFKAQNGVDLVCYEQKILVHLWFCHNLAVPIITRVRGPDETGDLKMTPVHGERSDEVEEDEGASPAGKLPSPSPFTITSSYPASGL